MNNLLVVLIQGNIKRGRSSQVINYNRFIVMTFVKSFHDHSIILSAGDINRREVISNHIKT